IASNRPWDSGSRWALIANSRAKESRPASSCFARDRRSSPRARRYASNATGSYRSGVSGRICTSPFWCSCCIVVYIRVRGTFDRGEIWLAVAAPRSRSVRYTRAWYSVKPCSINFRTRSWLIGTVPFEGKARDKRCSVRHAARARKEETRRGESRTIMPSSTGDRDLRRSLEKTLGADRVRMDEVSLHTYSTDASPCAIEPRAVVFVESEANVVAALQVCRELGVPLTPRASGTSLSGAAIGPGVVLDTTRFKEIVKFDAAKQTVTVQPGILLAELNGFLSAHHLRVAPDPGSQDLCRIGGMVGHNASGYRSVKYGPTEDHVLSLRVALVDGTMLVARDVRVDDPEWNLVAKQVPSLERVRAEIEVHRKAILSSRRPIRKHSFGYHLATIADSLSRGIFPLAALFVGSEGTLGIVTEVTLRVLPIPLRRVTVLLYLNRFGELGRLVADLLPLQPSAMEAIDGASLDLIGRESHGVPSGAAAMLLVEFDEGDLDAIIANMVGPISARYQLSRPAEVAE